MKQTRVSVKRWLFLFGNGSFPRHPLFQRDSETSSPVTQQISPLDGCWRIRLPGGFIRLGRRRRFLRLHRLRLLILPRSGRTPLLLRSVIQYLYLIPETSRNFIHAVRVVHGSPWIGPGVYLTICRGCDKNQHHQQTFHDSLRHHHPKFTGNGFRQPTKKGTAALSARPL